MNNPVAESVFVQALKDLANVLRQREDWGLSRVIDPDAPKLLCEIAEQLNDSNIEEMCAKCLEVISGFGWLAGRRDDLESLQAIAYHLGTLRQNPLRSEGDTFTQLNRALAENAYFFQEKAEQFEACIC
jgi:hypothetical protein